MPSAGPFRRFLDSVRSRPQLAFATAGVALAAVVTGGLIALALGGERPVADDPSPSPTFAAATEEVTPTPTATPSPSATPSPTESLAPSPSESASTTPTAATPTATPQATPEPTLEDRSWTALPPMPNAPAYFLRDLVVLQDGRVAAFRFQRQGDQRVSILTIAPGDEAWTRVEVDEPFDDFTTWIWAQGADGRLYSHALVIDPTGTTWDVEPWDPGFDEEPVAPVAALPDGRLVYRGAENPPELLFLDIETGAWERSSENSTGGHADALLVEAGLVYLVDVEQVVSYDPETDTWAGVTTMPYVNAARAGVAPDGRIVFLDAWETENQSIRVLDPKSAEWSELPRPIDAAPGWNPIFRTGPDGRLWAVDAAQGFVYLGD